MTAPRIRLTGHLDLQPERWDEILAALKTHIDLTRAEDGCLEFNVDPCPSIKHRLLVSELFVNKASFDAHQARTKASDWARVSACIKRQYEISEIPS